MFPPLLRKISSLLRFRSPKERRIARRLTPSTLTPCQIRLVGNPEPHTAWIHDLSTTGVAILTTTAFPAAALIELLIVNAAHTFALSGEVKIIRCTRVATGNYFLGGEFTNEVQHDELVPFIV